MNRVDNIALKLILAHALSFQIVPLVSRLCPSDVYKVFKRGSNVRIDTTLLGFDHTTWQRGNRSYIFKGDGENQLRHSQGDFH